MSRIEFTVTKKGYAPKEVDEYIAAMKREYESTIVKQRDRIKQMLQEKEECERELKSYREKSSQISKAIVSAVAKAEEIERLSRLKYNQEIERLKAFHEKWTKYYDKILDAYPLDARLAAAGEFNRRMDKILARVSGDDAAATAPVAQESAVAGAQTQEQAGGFDPMDRIGKYFAAERERETSVQTSPRQATQQPQTQQASAATAQQNGGKKDYADRSPSGFSLEEALNPTEDLESILKDLGLFSE